MSCTFSSSPVSLTDNAGFICSTGVKNFASVLSVYSQVTSPTIHQDHHLENDRSYTWFLCEDTVSLEFKLIPTDVNRQVFYSVLANDELGSSQNYFKCFLEHQCTKLDILTLWQNLPAALKSQQLIHQQPFHTSALQWKPSPALIHRQIIFHDDLKKYWKWGSLIRSVMLKKRKELPSC